MKQILLLLLALGCFTSCFAQIEKGTTAIRLKLNCNLANNKTDEERQNTNWKLNNITSYDYFTKQNLSIGESIHYQIDQFYSM